MGELGVAGETGEQEQQRGERVGVRHLKPRGAGKVWTTVGYGKSRAPKNQTSKKRAVPLFFFFFCAL